MKKKILFLTAALALVSFILILTFSSCAHKHEWGEWKTLKEATCSSEGDAERICECGEKETKKLPVIPHAEVIDGAVGRTCTADGLTEGKHCSLCNVVIVKQEVVPAAHSYVDTVVPPTAAADGYTTHTCSACGDSYTDSVIITEGSAGLVFELNSDGTAYTLKSLGTCTDTEIYLPASYKGLPVSAVGDRAFTGTDASLSIKKIILPDSIEVIGEQAFMGCSSLESMILPEKVSSIGSGAFMGCAKLVSVDIPQKITEYPDFIFKDCVSLKTVTLLTDATEIGERAFENCALLEGLTIPEKVTKIGKAAFSGCVSLTELHLSENVTNIGEGAFIGAVSLTVDEQNAAYRIESGCLIEIGTNKLIAGFKDAVIPEGTVEIAYGAFYACKGLTDITIPDSVSVIGAYAFAKCSSLIKIEISSSVTEIGSGAFNDCIAMQSLIIDPQNAVYRSEDGCVIEKSTDKLIVCLGNMIPEGVVCIGESSFANASALELVIIPKSVTEIEDFAFEGCSKLYAILYGGSSRKFKEVTVDLQKNPNFAAPAICFYSERRPSGEGVYWHYANGIPTIWEI